MLAGTTAPPVAAARAVRTAGVTSPPRNAIAAGRGLSVGHRFGNHRSVELRLGRDRVGHQDPAGMSEGRGGSERGRDLAAAAHDARQLRSTVAQIEGREAVGAPTQHGHTEGLEPLEGERHVEEGLDARRYDHHPVVGHGLQVRADIAAAVRSPVHPADAAGGKNLDADGGGQRHRGRHRGHAYVEARRQRWAQIAGPEFDGTTEQPLALVVAGADHSLAIEHAAERRDRTPGPNRSLRSLEALAVGRLRQSQLREDRGLQRHHGVPDDRAAATSSPSLRIAATLRAYDQAPTHAASTGPERLDPAGVAAAR